MFLKKVEFTWYPGRVNKFSFPIATNREFGRAMVCIRSFSETAAGNRAYGSCFGEK